MTDLSADADCLGERNRGTVSGIGLSQEEIRDQRNEVGPGPVQTIVHDPMYGFWLAGRYVIMREGVEASLIACTMSLTDSALPE